MLAIRSIFGGAKEDNSKFNQVYVSSVERAIENHDHEELSFLLEHKEIVDALKCEGVMGIRPFETILLSVAGSSHSHPGRKIPDIDMVAAELLIKAGANISRPAYWIGGFDGPMEFYIKDTYDTTDDKQNKEYSTVEAINQRYHSIRGKLARLFQPV